MLGALLAHVPAGLLQSPKLNLPAGLVLVAMVISTWWLALR